MTTAEAQMDMRRGYLSGAPGLVVSGVVWLIASAVAAYVSPQRAIWALVLGGMMIHPLAVALTKALGHPGRHTAGNPFGSLALEGTVWFVGAIAVAVVLGMTRVELFFPAMLILIGGRYLTFQTVYGVRLYWVIGGGLLALGFGAAFLRVPAAVVAAGGGSMEIIAGLLVWRQAR